MELSGIDARLAKERRARLQAERLLALRSEELYSAHRKLSEHANALSHQVIEQREENAALKGRTTQTAAALEVATDRAAQAERRLWDSLTAVEDGFAVFDRDCRLVVANPAFLGPFDGIADIAPGASYDAILRVAVDEGIVDLEGAHPDDWIERMLKRWERPNIPKCDIRLWDGSFVRLIDKRTPQGDTVCLGVDITGTIRRERQLQRARDAAIAASRAKSTFLANMSHEIRTPMNGVISMSELLRETELDEDQRVYADTIRNSAEALLVIINDILDYSKIEAGRLSIHEAEFNLLEIILDILRLLGSDAQSRGLEFRLSIDVPRIDRLIGDSGRVRQILFNLIGNAVKFTQTGHVEISVTGRGAVSAGRVPLSIAVRDTGIGIHPDLHSHVFGEFNQVEENANRSHDGTGLGLAITQRLVALMGGRIAVDSAPGEGSEFTVEIALGRPQDAGADNVEPGDAVSVVGPLTATPVQRLLSMLNGLGRPLRAGPHLPVDDACVASRTVILALPPDQAASAARDLQTPNRSGRVFALCHPASGMAAIEGTAPLELPPHEAELAALLSGAAAAAPPGAGTPPPAAARRLRVLAAEDNKTNRLVFSKMLKSLDIDLTIVENGADLVDAYRTELPDVIFTDVSMPGVDGLEATGRIRRHEAEAGLPRVPIVAMTAHALAGDRERLMEAGMDDYLTKPLKKDQLVDRIDRARSALMSATG